MFPRELLNGLWHATSRQRLENIINCGAISPEPDISDNERWSTSRGPEYYPYVRYLGGVSLFDFYNFDPIKYKTDYPVSNWSEFVPYCSRYEETVWIKINREDLSQNFINGDELLQKWKNENSLVRKLMPIIECAHLGELEVSKFDQVYLYEKENGLFIELPIL